MDIIPNTHPILHSFLSHDPYQAWPSNLMTPSQYMDSSDKSISVWAWSWVFMEVMGMGFPTWIYANSGHMGELQKLTLDDKWTYNGHICDTYKAHNSCM